MPTGFLQNYVFYVYDRNSLELASLYPMTATDDGNYEDIGVTFDSAATTSAFGSRYKFCKSIKFSNSNPEVATHILSATDNYKVSGTLTENVFSDRDVHKGYLAIWKNESLAAEKNKSFTVHPYWETPDHVTVEGIHTSTIDTGADASAETITIVNN